VALAVLAALPFAAVLPSGAARAQELIQTPGLEGCTQVTTVCAPWVFTGTDTFVFTAPHSGSNSAEVQPGFGGISIAQTVTLAKKGVYTFSFWYNSNYNSGDVQAITKIGGQTVFNQTLPLNATFQKFSTQVTLGAGANDVVFAATGGTSGNIFNFDDVSLTYLRAASVANTLPAGAPLNPMSVANGIDAFTVNGGTLPAGFDPLFNLTGAQLAAALAQLSGENATGAKQAGFQLMSPFLTLMLDPLLNIRGNGNVAPAIGYAPDRPVLPPDAALAYAAVLKGTPATRAAWNTWTSAYGGYNRTNGDAVGIGSNDRIARAYGVAAGADYRLSPDTALGFALAGGTTNWGLSSALGSGNSEAIQAGLYGMHRFGASYMAAAFGYAHHWMSTDRTVTVSGIDQLEARFQADVFGGRIETGRRLAMGAWGVTPYSALQVQTIRTPAYSETASSGSAQFALAFNQNTASDLRSELGARSDWSHALQGGATLLLRGRLAWAHDWVSDPTRAAVFQSLPGASFIVTGAPIARNSALSSTAVDLRLPNNWQVSALLDSEYAKGSRTYAATGTLRYSW
jgi:uncharacterized protein with beta-barrel porin domain